MITIGYSVTLTWIKDALFTRTGITYRDLAKRRAVSVKPSIIISCYVSEIFCLCQSGAKSPLLV